MNSFTFPTAGAAARARRFRALAVMAAALLAMLAGDAFAAAAKAFATPDELFAAVAQAAASDDSKALAQIFGSAGARILNSGDKVADHNAGQKFAASYAAKHSVDVDGTRATLVVGNDDWPFPVPAVKSADGWRLDAAAGTQEIMQRRIGKNELYTIETVRAIGDAQRDYASEPRTGKAGQYARKFVSTKGRKDGLYWPTAPGEPDSPLGPLVGSAKSEGYGKNMPYHGYYYRILTAQGPNAKGGARNYIVEGSMIGGFAVLAYPAQYDNTGVMTFVMSQDGVVYQKDLGEHTAGIASKITRFDPDSTWTKVADSNPAVPAPTLTVAGGRGQGAGAVGAVLDVTATVTAIDTASRALTLRGPQGNEVTVTAGPEVRNFDAIKVGDHVNVQYAEALALELHKGSTAPVARTVDKGGVAAPPGSRPMGAGARSVTIMAEVMAVDRDKPSITLRGPERTLELPVRDKSLLDNVAVGDRVEATYTQALAIAVAPAR